MDIGIACLLFLFTALYIGTAHADLHVNDVVSGVDAMSGYIDKHHVDELTRTGPRTTYIILAKNEEREERKREQRKREQEHDNEDDDLAENEEREESKKNKEKEHEDDDEVPTTSTERTATDNIIALHDRNSPQYNRNCSDCHADIHRGESLNPSIPDAHVAMLPFAPGETDSNDKCTWCHRSVDLVQASGSPLVVRNSIIKHFDPRLCTMCHGPGGPAKQFYQETLSSLQLDGSELYDLTCSGCHRVLADSEVEGESAAEIQNKINGNEGGMGPLVALKTEQIQSIAVALGGDPTPLPPPTDGVPPPTDGVALYSQNCASCHGGLANSDKQGTSAALIQSAIDSNTGGMGSLGALNTQQVQTIAAALVQ
jgi:mono/diheme cytochrome c family protein